ncbi:hypothetical protein C1I97_37945 [Streptomyces sp. NTH33]|uniref:hypothetical protein n=1 Tax=Streptomyces sp. NTH33 TaxID=1735453 RepID=UPI000DA88EE9|nr:hypothetical protein [Streptomyces sp. NTH33]PZG72589.1 hypothetical protein C1I97_37945 [Streptomyces sp. NTH33]
MTRQLTTHNATITTAAVEVKTLTIRGKQVSLSVFRQLREEPLIADDGTLNGVPWGTVNYHPDKCTDLAEHWHIVWQHGQELRRARVFAKPDFDREPYEHGTFWAEEADLFVEVWAHEWLHGRVSNQPLPRDRHHTWGAGRFLTEVKFNMDGLTVGAVVNDTAINALNARLELDYARKQMESSGYDWQQEQLAKAEARAADTLAALDAGIDDWNITFDEAHAAYRKAVADEVARRRRHRDVRATLAQLPQLFIAV